ncbi:MAG: deoxyribose-phosphate aldolase [Bacteroidota bacterium]|nr:deoxyribose-phosphate aldolase [Bacteroidota bacterium]
MQHILDEATHLLADWIRGERVGKCVDVEESQRSLAGVIDHTLLKADAVEEDIRRICREGLEYGFASVCVNPVWVPLCADLLAGSAVRVCTVIGFPLGAVSPSTKIQQASRALEDGACEFDMVMLIGHLKSGRLEAVLDDIRGVVGTVKSSAPASCVKVIVETCFLDTREKILAVLLAREAGADFVKTSTGFGPEGAVEGDVALLRFVAGDAIRVKASGGIRTRQEALRMLEAGADRIGTSSGVSIVRLA